MKNNKVLIIIGVVLLNILVVFMVGQSFLGKASEYDIKLKEARAFSEQELCVKSIEAYKSAFNLKPSIEIYEEIVNVYDKGIEIGEISKAHSVFSAVYGYVDNFKENPKAYEIACNFHIKYGKYDSCAALLMQADDLHVTSKGLKKILDDVRYMNKLSHTMYSNISSLYDGSYLADTDGIYNLLTPEISKLVGGDYDYASSFSEGYAFVRLGSVDSDYRSFVINKEGIRQVYLDGVTESSGVGKANNKEGDEILLLSCKVKDRYKYYDLSGKEVFGDYVFAGRFRNNVAAVQESEGKWKLINGAGEAVVDTVFEDVVLNEFAECAPKGLIFAKKDGKYNLYDMNGKKIGDFACDEARAFIEDKAAFKKGDKWGFVDTTGKVVIEPQYDDAKSFCTGIAGVLHNGYWGFIDASNKLVIEGNYEDAGYLSNNGKCFVKINGRWSVLNMYYIAD